MKDSIILYLIGAAALGLVIFSLIRIIRLRKCRKIKGRVVDEIYRSSTDSDGVSSTSRYPVYEYEWQGETYHYESHGSGGKPVGAEVELYIDADGVIYEKRTTVFLLLFGLGFLFVVAVSLLN